MNMNPYTPLIELCDRYAEHSGITHWRVSFLVRGDGQFFNRLKEGRGCTMKTAISVQQWFSDNWPLDLEWPEGIERPAPSAERKSA